MADSMDAVFQALAAQPRRQMLDIVKATPGCSVGHVAEFFPFSRIAVMKHLKVLTEAGLIVSRKEGRTRRLYFNSVPIQLIYDRWTGEYSALWASKLTELKYRIEAKGKKHAARDAEAGR